MLSRKIVVNIVLLLTRVVYVHMYSMYALLCSSDACVNLRADRSEKTQKKLLNRTTDKQAAQAFRPLNTCRRSGNRDRTLGGRERPQQATQPNSMHLQRVCTTLPGIRPRNGSNPVETALSSACMLNDRALIATKYPVMSMLKYHSVVAPLN